MFSFSSFLHSKIAVFFGALAIAISTSFIVATLHHPTNTQQQAAGLTTSFPSTNKLAVHIVGNHLVDGQGQSIRIIGLDNIHNPCLLNARGESGIYDFPSTSQSAASMANWHSNAVRLMLNEDRWLNINNFTPDSGIAYQQSIINYVNLLHSYGMYVIVDLHCNAPGTYLSTSQQVMADADHGTAYWTSVANTFKNDPAVIFEAYNEPHITTTNAQTTNPWQCWRDGCMVTELYENHQLITAPPWQGLGMQSIVNAIRSTGAANPILLGGLNWSQDLSQILQYLPTDPQNQLATAYHNYISATSKNNLTYWNNVIGLVALQMPVITTEFGEKDMQSTYVVPYMNWADAHGISYTAFVWGDWTGGYALLSNWDGTPSPYGQVFYDHFKTINSGVSITPPTPTCNPRLGIACQNPPSCAPMPPQCQPGSRLGIACPQPPLSGWCPVTITPSSQINCLYGQHTCPQGFVCSPSNKNVIHGAPGICVSRRVPIQGGNQ